MEIGIFGGTFNPIHNGHLIVAEQIREWFGLDRIYFVTSAIPPHKEGPILQVHHRLKMVSLATDSNPYFYASSVEADRGGSSYTIDTIRELKKTLGEGHNLYFIIGADAFKEITAWKDYKSLLICCKFIVIGRPGINLSEVQKGLSSILPKLGINLKLKKVGGFGSPYSIEPAKSDIFFIPVPQIDISSTQIRQMVKRGKSIRYQVPEAVGQYITTMGLYLE